MFITLPSQINKTSKRTRIRYLIGGSLQLIRNEILQNGGRRKRRQKVRKLIMDAISKITRTSLQFFPFVL